MVKEVGKNSRVSHLFGRFFTRVFFLLSFLIIVPSLKAQRQSDLTLN